MEPLATRCFRLLSRRPWVVVAIALVLALMGGLLAKRLALRTAFFELLPDNDPGVVALNATQKRMGDLSLLLVGIRSPDPAANERYAEALTTHLRALPRAVCDIATYHLRDLRAFVQQNRWLYASEEDLETVRDRLRAEIAKRKNPLFVDLGDEGEDDALKQRLASRDPLAGRFPGGVFRNQAGTSLWVAALPPGGIMVEHAGDALLAATNAFIRAHPPSNFHPAMDVEPTGPVVTPIRNRDALQRDLTWVAVVCVVLISLSIGLYFRRLRAVAFVAGPAVMATLLSYAAAYLAFGYLTTVTSFLVAFIMGNGTNYAIMFMARYEDERRSGTAARQATVDSCLGLWRSTGIAALASAVSYLSLTVTSFRGFSQFGVMGAVGCLLAWVATFTLLPALLCLFDRRGPAANLASQAGRPLRALAGFIERSPAKILVTATVVTVLMIGASTRFASDAFEYDFRKLGARGIADHRIRTFDREKDDLFGRWPQPTLVLADRPDDVPALRAAIRRSDAAAPGPDVIEQIITIENVLPGSTEVQARKLMMLANIRRLTNDPALGALDNKERSDIERLRPPGNLRVLRAADLPPLVRRPFTEADGTTGRVMLVYPRDKGLSVWNGRDLLRIAVVLQNLPLPDGRTVQTSGNAVIFSAMIRSILRDGPIATIASLSAVMLLVLLRVRPFRSAWLVIGILLTGVFWMTGAAAWLGIKITFVNFIALPFIFGVGVEYAIHIATEYRERGRIAGTVISAGGPVALCSWSAIVGYGSLLAAQNGALRGLGGVAALGETTCLLAAVIVMPAALSWLSARKRGGRVTTESGPYD